MYIHVYTEVLLIKIKQEIAKKEKPFLCTIFTIKSAVM